MDTENVLIEGENTCTEAESKRKETSARQLNAATVALLLDYRDFVDGFATVNEVTGDRQVRLEAANCDYVRSEFLPRVHACLERAQALKTKLGEAFEVEVGIVRRRR